MTAPILYHYLDSQITRRSIVFGAAASLICGPAIVRPTSLMPVRNLRLPIGPQYAGFVERLKYDWMEKALSSGWDIRRHGQIFGGISEAQARNSVAYARAQGWLPKPAAGS